MRREPKFLPSPYLDLDSFVLIFSCSNSTGIDRPFPSDWVVASGHPRRPSRWELDTVRFDHCPLWHKWIAGVDICYQ